MGPKITYPLTTREYARFQGVQQSTVRERVRESGSYFGDVPVKRPNGRWAWPNPYPALKRAAEAAERDK